MNWYQIAMGAGAGGFVTYVTPILWRKAQAAWASFRAAK